MAHERHGAHGEPVPTPHPLIASARRLSELDSRTRLAMSGFHGADWFTLSEAGRRSVVEAWLDELPATGCGMRNVAAAQLAAGLACCVVRPLMALLHREGRMPNLRPGEVHIRWSGREFDHLALTPGEVYALPNDPEIEHPSMLVVSTMDELVERAAEILHRVLSPVLHTIRLEGRYGLPLLWGAVLDMIGATSLLVARISRLDQQLVWQQAKQLCALVQERADQPLACHPQPFPVEWSGGAALYTVKGTCCLQYREHGPCKGDRESGSVYCKTCPFLREEARKSECSRQLERDMIRIN